MRILITGACGMLGRDLVEALSKEHEVVGVDVKDPGSWILDLGSVEFSKLDITNEEEVMKAICDVKPEVVIHTAAYTDVDDCEKNEDLAYRINGTGAQNVALACKKCKAIMTYISTDFIFDGEKKEPYLENDKPNPLSVYGKSKLEGEKHISLLLDRYFIIRTSWLFGKHGKNFVNTILKLAKEKKELKVVNDQVGSPTYTKDLAHAIKHLLNLIQDLGSRIQNLFGIYHISNNGSCSWYEFAQEILQVAGRPPHPPQRGETSLQARRGETSPLAGRSQVINIKIKPISSEELDRPAKRPKFSVLDNSRYIKTVGEPLRLWQKDLEEYLKNGPS
ncbi:dTDP-4-dehydrorhamnose reductase [bacterium]|nr:dTDP-4-dehydrorhamnose reductase [bacterium]MCG2676284.1 dTDP-4-dehydrorhamnose reductase [bacterium]